MSKVKIMFLAKKDLNTVICTLKIYRDEDTIKGSLQLNMEDEILSIYLNGITKKEYEEIRLEILKEIFYVFVVKMKYILYGKHKYDFIELDDCENRVAEYKIIEPIIDNKESQSLLKEIVKYDKANFDISNEREIVISYIKGVISQIAAYEEDNSEEIKNNGKLFIKYSEELNKEEKEICERVLHDYFYNLAIDREENNLDAYYRGVELYEHNGIEYLCYKKCLYVNMN